MKTVAVTLAVASAGILERPVDTGIVAGAVVACTNGAKDAGYKCLTTEEIVKHGLKQCLKGAITGAEVAALTAGVATFFSPLLITPLVAAEMAAPVGATYGCLSQTVCNAVFGKGYYAVGEDVKPTCAALTEPKQSLRRLSTQTQYPWLKVVKKVTPTAGAVAGFEVGYIGACQQEERCVYYTEGKVANDALVGSDLITNVVDGTVNGCVTGAKKSLETGLAITGIATGISILAGGPIPTLLALGQALEAGGVTGALAGGKAGCVGGAIGGFIGTETCKPSAYCLNKAETYVKTQTELTCTEVTKQ